MTEIKTRKEAKSKYQGHRKFTVEYYFSSAEKVVITYRTDDIYRAKAFARTNGGYIVDHRPKHPTVIVNACRVCGREVVEVADFAQENAHYHCDPAAFHRNCDEDCTWQRINDRKGVR